MSRFESLSMEHLAKLDHDNIFEHTDATHVVTGLLYGAEIYFVFERRVGSDENCFEVHANMEALIKKLPKVTIGFETEGKVEVTGKDHSSNLKFALQPGKLEKIVHSFKFKRVVSFEFIINLENAFLLAMEEYLTKEKAPESSLPKSWCVDTNSLRKYAKLFKQLMLETQKRLGRRNQH